MDCLGYARQSTTTSKRARVLAKRLFRPFNIAYRPLRRPRTICGSIQGHASGLLRLKFFLQDVCFQSCLLKCCIWTPHQFNTLCKWRISYDILKIIVPNRSCYTVTTLGARARDWHSRPQFFARARSTRPPRRFWFARPQTRAPFSAPALALVSPGANMRSPPFFSALATCLSPLQTRSLRFTPRPRFSKRTPARPARACLALAHCAPLQQCALAHALFSLALKRVNERAVSNAANILPVKQLWG